MSKAQEIIVILMLMLAVVVTFFIVVTTSQACSNGLNGITVVSFVVGIIKDCL